jgi:hypothetical protein
MATPPAETFEENRQRSYESGEKVEFSRAYQCERGRQHQKKHGRAEELLRGKWLRRGGDGGGHRLNLQDSICGEVRNFTGA